MFDVDREPVTSTVLFTAVQTNVARDAFRADDIKPQYRSPGVTGMRGVIHLDNRRAKRETGARGIARGPS